MAAARSSGQTYFHDLELALVCKRPSMENFLIYRRRMFFRESKIGQK